jgi:type VI secretion system protein ImpA
MNDVETNGGVEFNNSARVTIRSRDEAYALLSSIADYLMRVEPHSPAPYLVKRAVTWGSMPLASLLQELVGENRELLEIYQLLGMGERS